MSEYYSGDCDSEGEMWEAKKIEILVVVINI